MNLPDCLEHADGDIRLTGHRLTLFHVLDRYQAGYSPEMIGEEFPTLPLALIHRVIAFYRDNQAQLDAYVSDCRKALDEHEAACPPSPAAVQIRKRLNASHSLETGTARP